MKLQWDLHKPEEQQKHQRRTLGPRAAEAGRPATRAQTRWRRSAADRCVLGAGRETIESPDLHRPTGCQVSQRAEAAPFHRVGQAERCQHPRERRAKRTGRGGYRRQSHLLLPPEQHTPQDAEISKSVSEMAAKGKSRNCQAKAES